MIDITPALARIEAAFATAGHELWLVGGCVRDHLRGIAPKDIDLATTATPEEQIAIYDASGIHHIPTGLQHGTITAVADGEAYEITTFRTESDHDGRHATVAYTRDLADDLSRRDLTINAIAMSFSGEIVDPFGGVDDVRTGTVRFVGEPRDRIREDYLRIMRWFRFVGRFAENLDIAGSDVDAITAEADSLSRISVERIWAEMQRILSGPRPYGVIDLMDRTGVLRAIGITSGDTDRLAAMTPHTGDPCLLLAAWLGADASETAKGWKASNAECDAAAFAASRLAGYDLASAKADLVEGVPMAWIAPVLKTRGQTDVYRAIADWDVPTFPVQGRDLIAAGRKPGPAMGEGLAAMKRSWAASDYAKDRDSLIAEWSTTDVAA